MRKRAAAKPKFPLWQHTGKGLWCKKVGKSFYYFGSIADDPDGDKALAQWLASKDRLLVGEPKRQPIEDGDGLTLTELLDRYLISKKRLVESGDRTQRTYDDAKSVCDRMLAMFGGDTLVRSLAADDFERLRSTAAKTCGPRTLDGLVVRVRCIFNWAEEAGLIDWKVRYGQFKLSSRKVLDKDAEQRGEKTLPRESILKLLKHADVQMKAMILLAINCGYGPSDLGHLPLSKVDGGEWLAFPRVKTAAPRKAWLWPETQQAIADWLAVRPQREDELGKLVFFTHRGKPWARDDKSHSPVSNHFTRLAEGCGIEHRGFYGLRHTHRTISDNALDQPAANYVMGHLPPSRDMSSRYRKPADISDDRVKAVCEEVRKWLFGTVKAKKATKKPAALRIVG